MSQTRISVVIPTHHRGELLIRAVRSALACCGPADEVIVVADHDPEARQSIVQLQDPRLSFLENTGTRGASATRNHGVNAAQGETILFLDDDDELLEGCIERVAEAMMQDGASWGFSTPLFRSDISGPPAPSKPATLVRGLTASSVPFRRKLPALSEGFWAKRAVFLEVGGLKEDQTVDEDTDLCCRFLAAGLQPWYEPEPGTIVDRTPDTPRLTSKDDDLRNAECYLRTFLANFTSLDHEKGAVLYLGMRAQRMIAKAGNSELLERFRQAEVTYPERLVLRLQGVLLSARKAWRS